MSERGERDELLDAVGDVAYQAGAEHARSHRDQDWLEAIQLMTEYLLTHGIDALRTALSSDRETGDKRFWDGFEVECEECMDTGWAHLWDSGPKKGQMQKCPICGFPPKSSDRGDPPTAEGGEDEGRHEQPHTATGTVDQDRLEGNRTTEGAGPDSGVTSDVGRGDPPEEGREALSLRLDHMAMWMEGAVEGEPSPDDPTAYPVHITEQNARDVARAAALLATPVPPEREPEPVAWLIMENGEPVSGGPFTDYMVAQSKSRAEMWRDAHNSIGRNLEIVPLYRHPPREPEGERIELTWLPAHNAGLHLTHNEHRCYYESVEGFMSRGAADWVSGEERERAIEADEVWCLQWYPETPVGFNAIAASSLEALRRAIHPASDSEEG